MRSCSSSVYGALYTALHALELLTTQGPQREHYSQRALYRRQLKETEWVREFRKLRIDQRSGAYIPHFDPLSAAWAMFFSRQPICFMSDLIWGSSAGLPLSCFVERPY